MKKRSIILGVIIIIFIGLMAGGFLFLRKKQTSPVPLDKSKIEYAAAEGKILSIGQNQIQISVQTLGLENQAATTSEKTLSFSLAKTTRLVSETDEVKSEAEFNQEQLKFNQLLPVLSAAGESTIAIAAPGWHKLKEAQLIDFVIGSEVLVYSTLAEKNNTEPLAAKLVMTKSAAVVPPAGGKEIFEVNGELRETKKDSLVVEIIKTEPGQANNADYQPTAEKKEINYGNQTEIFSQTRKSEAEFEKEQAEFVNKYNSSDQNAGGLIAPSWYLFNKLTPEDLRVGAGVTVRGYLQDGQSFAEEIILN